MFSSIKTLFDVESSAPDAEKWRESVKKLFDKAEDAVRNVKIPEFVALFPEENCTPTTPRLLSGPEQIELVEKNLSAVRSTYTHMMDIDVQALAQEMTLMEFELLSLIQPTELTQKRFDDVEQSPNVHVCLQRAELHQNWCLTELLYSTSLKQRAITLGLFIELAQELLKLNNFSGVLSIMRALQSQSIAKLRITWKSLPKHLLGVFETIKELVQDTDDYALFRKKMDAAGHPQIPVLEFIVNDLRTIEAQENVVQCEGRVFVNWKKLDALGSRILQLTRSQEIKYQLDVHDDVRVYLAVQKTRSQAEHEKISKVLEQEEKSTTTRARRSSIRMRKIDSKEFYKERDRERKNLELSRSDSSGDLTLDRPGPRIPSSSNLAASMEAARSEIPLGRSESPSNSSPKLNSSRGTAPKTPKATPTRSNSKPPKPRFDTTLSIKTELEKELALLNNKCENLESDIVYSRCLIAEMEAAFEDTSSDELMTIPKIQYQRLVEHRAEEAQHLSQNQEQLAHLAATEENINKEKAEIRETIALTLDVIKTVSTLFAGLEDLNLADEVASQAAVTSCIQSTRAAFS